MSRSFKKKPENGKFQDRTSILAGVIIINGSKEIFVKTKFISGFGYGRGARKKIPLDQKTFSEKIDPNLPFGNKNSDQEKEIRLLGPDFPQMGDAVAYKFQDFLRQNGLRFGVSYKVKRIVRNPITKKKLQLQMC